MQHKFLQDGDWFAPKRYGYGAGLPIAWQGWALSLAYCLAMTGLAYSLPHLPRAQLPVVVAGMLALTALFLLIVAKRTRGGWRWRRGERD
jgi:hypothetical protein